MKIPRKITPCPILESTVEIRFEHIYPSDAVFGVLYPYLSSQYGNFESLPILQIPEALRSQDPNLKYQPSYKLTDNDFWVQIGSNSISITNVNNYAGWDTFSERINNILTCLTASNIVKKVARFGIRYISFFSLDIFEKIKINVTLSGEPFPTEQMIFRSLLRRDDFLINLQVANKTVVNQSTEIGSVIDIDTSIEGDGLTIQAIESFLLKESHQKEKELFFGILSEDFLNSLNPEY
jgi:uncharacterized protein (TIGR04255 family)